MSYKVISNNISSATPWIERYRPQSLDDVSHQTEIIATLRNAVQTNRLPHLLFYGPPGTGKTSVALALCRSLWHPSQLKQRVLELNASDERGISVVRDKIKHFASLAVGTLDSNTNKGNGASGGVKSFFQSSTTNNSNHKSKPAVTREPIDDENVNMDVEKRLYPNPPFKIIILDEADTVTPDAQAALRRIIEAYSKITRFILICNYVTRIIEPLASRCAKFRFQSLPATSMKNRLREIAHNEQCVFFSPSVVSQLEEDETTMKQQGDCNNDEEMEDKMENLVLDEILLLSKGDMRRAIQTLQSAHSLSGSGVILKESISEMTGWPPTKIIDTLMTLLQNPRATFDDMTRMVRDEILLEGYSAKYIISSLLENVTSMPDHNLGDVNKACIAIKIAEMDKLLVDGADETLQLVSLCSFIQRCFKK